MSVDPDLQSIVTLGECLRAQPADWIRVLEAVADYHDSVMLLVASFDHKRQAMALLRESLPEVLTNLETVATTAQTTLSQALASVTTGLDEFLGTLDRVEDAVRHEAANAAHELDGLRTTLGALGGQVDAHRGRAAATAEATRLRLIASGRQVESAVSTTAAKAATLIPPVKAAAESTHHQVHELAEEVDRMAQVASRQLSDMHAAGRLAELFPKHFQALSDDAEALAYGVDQMLERLPPPPTKTRTALDTATAALRASVAQLTRAMQDAEAPWRPRHDELERVLGEHRQAKDLAGERVLQARTTATTLGIDWPA